MSTTAIQESDDRGAEDVDRERRSAWRRAVGASTVTSAAFIAVGVAGIALVLVPELRGTWMDQDLSRALESPFDGSLLGTDQFGRELLPRVVAGLGVSLLVAGIVTVASLAIGVPLGLLAGYRGGRADLVIGGCADAAWGFPAILLAVVLAGIVGPGLPTVIVALVAIQWAGFVRVVRGEALALKERDFVVASRALGRGDWYIIRRHLLPNVAPSLLVVSSYFVPVVIIAEAGLTFIGVGAQPPTPSLGQLLADGRDFMFVDPSLVLIPSAVLALFTLALNAAGDRLRDVLDPSLALR